jgi:putative transposase
LSVERSVQRYIPKRVDDEESLRNDIISLASKYGRYGYRRITALLKANGWRVNHKRVERIWHEEGLKVPKRQKKRGRLYFNDGSCIRLKPLYPNHVWSYDFVSDRLNNGKKIRMLTIIDEFSRRCLAIKVEHSLKSDNVLEILSDLFVTEAIPDFIRSDNGSEFKASILQDWLAALTVKTAYITPGSPWENGFCERFNGSLRDELLNGESFYTLYEAKTVIESWRKHYNEVRPHSSLNYNPPSPKAIVSNAYTPNLTLDYILGA